MKEYWIAKGSVRGACPHKHRTREAAQKCADRDNAACRRLPGGNAYSDRGPWLIEPDAKSV